MSADRNLLFGILALQMDLISRDALVQAMHAWVLEKQKPLGQLLEEQGGLSAEHRHLLEPLVAAHLEAHGNDAEKSLAALSSIGSAREALEKIRDLDVQQSLRAVAAGAPVADAPGSSADLSATRPSEITPIGLPRFRILRKHAKGGLGEVFVASDEELNREVALKEIQLQHADQPKNRARFLLEAEITGGLEHPGIVPVYGLGTHMDGRPYYAMRFIRGDSLKEAIDRFHAADSVAFRSAKGP